MNIQVPSIAFEGGLLDFEHANPSVKRNKSAINFIFSIKHEFKWRATSGLAAVLAFYNCLPATDADLKIYLKLITNAQKTYASPILPHRITWLVLKIVDGCK